MVSQNDFDAYVESQRNVRKLALRDVSAWLTLSDGLSDQQMWDRAYTDIPMIAQTYGDVSSTAAADFYQQSRDASVARGTYRSTLAPSQAADYVKTQLPWALNAPSSDQRLSRMQKIVDEASLQDGRNTIIRNAQRDPSRPRWARVPVGKTCAWCLMIASRGAVYRSADSAGAAKKFHNHCDCQPVATWDHGNDLPPSYDEGHLYGLYDRARADAGSGDPKQIAAAFRRLDGGALVADGVAPKQLP